MSKVTVIANALTFTTDGRIVDKRKHAKLVVGSFERQKEEPTKKLQGEDKMLSW